MYLTTNYFFMNDYDDDNNTSLKSVFAHEVALLTLQFSLLVLKSKLQSKQFEMLKFTHMKDLLLTFSILTVQPVNCKNSRQQSFGKLFSATIFRILYLQFLFKLFFFRLK